ncbi:unnamed protein product [Clonostachys solani]|uniref:Oxidoreductase n=1 Tax=Clonostachys solani TaxID=160281 RepID=A0A9N9YZ61_9HYPO|nr:unnamed protein product [Clonostachys solani]
MSRVWFVTAASRGLGREIVEAALAAGDNVIATARDPASLEHFTKKYGSDRVHAFALDVTDSDQVFSVVKDAHKVFGRIDIVVNNAGFAQTSSLEDMDVESFKRQVDTNFFGTVWVTKAVVPIMREQGSGHIIQISSVGGRLGTPGMSGYQSAKWAVGGLTTVLASEVAPFGIKTTVLEPGGMKTDWAGSSMEHGVMSEPYKQTVGAFEELRKSYEPHWTPPEKVANAVVLLSKVEDPPLRLLVCPETPQIAKTAAAQLAESDAKWENFSINLTL